MDNDKKRFQAVEKLITYVLIGCAALFVLYLISAGIGIIWLKALSAIIAILVCALCLVYLYITKLLGQSRSLWMAVGAGALILCILFSLIVGFPSPL